jgi:hypothetical protein
MPGRQDVDRLPGEACSKLGLPKAGQRIGQRVLLGTELPQVDAEGEAQEVGSVERGPQGALEDRLLDGSTQSGRGLSHAVGGSGRAGALHPRGPAHLGQVLERSHPRERGVPPRPTGAVD